MFKLHQVIHLQVHSWWYSDIKAGTQFCRDHVVSQTSLGNKCELLPNMLKMCKFFNLKYYLNFCEV